LGVIVSSFGRIAPIPEHNDDIAVEEAPQREHDDDPAVPGFAADGRLRPLADFDHGRPHADPGQPAWPVAAWRRLGRPPAA